MILDLVEAGKRVGVTAQSHRVIANLLESVQRAAAEEHRFVRIGQRFDGEDDAGDTFGIERIPKSDAVAPGLRAGTWDVVGATSWVWAREELEGSLDVLFVDEAGPAVARHGVLGRGRRVVGRPAGRPEPAAAGLAGDASGGGGGVGARAPRRRGEDDPARPRPVARDDVPPPPGGQRVHLRRLLRGPPRDPPQHVAPAGRGRPAGRRLRASGPSRCARQAPRTGRARRPPGSRTRWPRCAAAGGSTRRATTGRSRSTTSSSSRPTTRRSPRSGGS